VSDHTLWYTRALKSLNINVCLVVSDHTLWYTRALKAPCVLKPVAVKLDVMLPTRTLKSPMKMLAHSSAVFPLKEERETKTKFKFSQELDVFRAF